MEAEPSSTLGEKPQGETVEKADGITASERYLGMLCERNFLSMWSYPGIFRDQGKPHGGHGKEICDLLVIFDEHIIIFSDKHCQFPDTGKPELDWQRWFKKAIHKSAEQAWGAERWIREHPNRIFLDRECTKPLPIDLPSIKSAKFHLVVVAHGVSQRIRQFFSGSSGSLIIASDIKGFENHKQPFRVGDAAPEKSFIHILDDFSLNTLMRSRDTISDFVLYLLKRGEIFRGKTIIHATGEEELLAIYLKNLNENNEHDFIFPTPAGEIVDKIFLQEGHWNDFQQSPERRAQLEADKISYAWDGLIEKFNHHALNNQQYFVSPGGIKDTERALRFLAREPRWKRRILAQILVEMLKITPVEKRRLRVLPPMDKGDPHYVFLLYPHLSSHTYEEYRLQRRNFLECCCIVAKREYPVATDIIGIATETGMSRTDGRSEDIIYLDASEWNDTMAKRAEELQEKLGILKKANPIKIHVEEYPNVPTPGGLMKNPRNKPCPCGSGKKYKRCCWLKT